MIFYDGPGVSSMDFLGWEWSYGPTRHMQAGIVIQALCPCISEQALPGSSLAFVGLRVSHIRDHTLRITGL
jgi:hypothetical protein